MLDSLSLTEFTLLLILVELHQIYQLIFIIFLSLQSYCLVTSLFYSITEKIICETLLVYVPGKRKIIIHLVLPPLFAIIYKIVDEQLHIMQFNVLRTLYPSLRIEKWTFKQIVNDKLMLKEEFSLMQEILLLLLLLLFFGQA